MSMRVTLTVDVDAITDQQAYTICTHALRGIQFGFVDFEDCAEIDTDPTAKVERDLAYGADVPQGDGWRGR